jgi:RNase adapter protein RapZ
MSDSMRLIIVSGLSGSGKTVALHVLEDLGYYCIDNLPAGLLKRVVEEVSSGPGEVGRGIAVGIDARNRPSDLESLPRLIEEFRQHNIQTDVLFVLADDAVLLKRYSETRRRHPLAEHGTELRAAIEAEREILTEVINSADLVIDTSRTSVYELANIIRERVDRRAPASLSVLIESFGYKHGIPADADFVFDLRCLPNPYWDLNLRQLTGLDEEVVEFLDAQQPVATMHADILAFLKRWIPEYRASNRSFLTIAIGCTGGQHRSVYMAEKLAKSLRDFHDPVSTRHNEL